MIRFLSTKRGGAIVRFAATVLRPFGLSRFASHRFAPLPHIAGAALTLALIFLFVFALPALFGGL